MRPDLNTNGQHPATSPTGLSTTGDSISSDEVQPLEQWLLTEGSPSSAHLCYSPQDLHLTDRSLDAVADLHPMFSLVDFNNSLYQKPQQDMSYKGQPSLPMVGGSLQGCKSSQIPAEQPRSHRGEGYQGIPSEHTHNLYSRGSISVSSTSVLASANVETSGLDPVQFPQSSSSQILPLSHQPTLAKVPSNSPSVRESLMDPHPSSASLEESSERYSLPQGGGSLDIKQEPGEEKELGFQSVGLRDITLDDGKTPRRTVLNE